MPEDYYSVPVIPNIVNLFLKSTYYIYPELFNGFQK